MAMMSAVTGAVLDMAESSVARQGVSREHTAMEPVYEICAVRYAHLERTASHNFIGGDEHDGPMPLDYYVWTIRGPDVCFVLDTGFDAATGAARGRQLVRPVG